MSPVFLLALALALLLGLATGFLLGRRGCVPRQEVEQERERREREGQWQRDAFAALSAQQLQSQSQEFRQRQREELSGLLAPYRNRLEEFVRELQNFQQGNQRDNSSLRGAMGELVRQAEAIGKEARRLASVLGQGTKSQGLFGEQVLGTILRSSELRENVHFFLQQALRDTRGRVVQSEEGNRRIPDCVVVLPDSGAYLVVDSKCSAAAYLRLDSASTEAEKTAARRDFLKAMRSHIDELAAKDYAAILRQSRECTVVDCVLLFVPLESMLQTALAEQPELLEYAATRKILLVGPLNLMACLRVVGLAWGNLRLERNVRQIHAATEQLLARMESFQECFADVKKWLDRAGESLAQAHQTLLGQTERGRKKSLLQCAEEIRRLRQQEEAPSHGEEKARDAETEEEG